MCRLCVLQSDEELQNKLLKDGLDMGNALNHLSMDMAVEQSSDMAKTLYHDNNIHALVMAYAAYFGWKGMKYETLPSALRAEIFNRIFREIVSQVITGEDDTH